MILLIVIYWTIMGTARTKELHRSILNLLHIFITTAMLVILNTLWKSGLNFFQKTPRPIGW